MNHRLLTLILAAAMATLATVAQVPAQLSTLFDGRYHDNPAATETVISGEPLKPYYLDVFHSLAVKGDPSLAAKIEQAVRTDGARAKWKETVMKGGKLQSGVYELESKRRHRYILYLSTFVDGGDEATVIYLEGKALPGQIKKLIRTISK